MKSEEEQASIVEKTEDVGEIGDLEGERETGEGGKRNWTFVDLKREILDVRKKGN